MELELRRCVAPLNGRINHWDWDTRLPLQLFTCGMFHGLNMRAAFITALARKNIHDCLLCVKIISLQCFILSAHYLFIIWLAHYLDPILSHNLIITVKNLSWKDAEQRCCLLMLSWPQTYSCIRLVLNRKSDEVLLRDSISIMPRKCGLTVYISVSEKSNTPSGKQNV